MSNLVGNPAQDLDWLDIAEQGPYNQQPKNGGAYTTPQQQIGQAAVNQAVNPMLTPDHYGTPNAQGLVPINESGFKHLNSNIPSRPTIADNSNMINPTPSAGIPQGGDSSIVPLQKGLIGRAFDNYVSNATGGIIGNAFNKLQQNASNPSTTQTTQRPIINIDGDDWSKYSNLA